MTTDLSDRAQALMRALHPGSDRLMVLRAKCPYDARIPSDPGWDRQREFYQREHEDMAPAHELTKAGLLAFGDCKDNTPGTVLYSYLLTDAGRRFILDRWKESEGRGPED